MRCLTFVKTFFDGFKSGNLGACVLLHKSDSLFLLDSSNDELLGMLFRQVPQQSVPSRAAQGRAPARYSTS